MISAPAMTRQTLSTDSQPLAPPELARPLTMSDLIQKTPAPSVSSRPPLGDNPHPAVWRDYGRDYGAFWRDYEPYRCKRWHELRGGGLLTGVQHYAT